MSGFAVSLRRRLPGFCLDVNWAVDRGFTVLFGYSGSGKSLTLSMIAGTVPADTGRIAVDGEVLFDSAAGVLVPPQRRGFGYVSQSAELFPHMTVRSNIDYALGKTPRAQRRARTDELLEALRIADLADKRPHQISGGQRQRAALARALAPRPRALLLDEPFSALDLPVRVELRELLRQVHLLEGIPVVMVTHDLLEACALADTLVVYGGNGVVQVGAPAELIGDPGTPAIRRLLHAMEVPERLLARA